MKDELPHITTLPSWRYEEIKGIASNVLCECEITHLPVSGFEIARRLGISVIPYSHCSEKLRSLYKKASPDGFNIVKPDGTATIYYNDDMPYTRVNFTLLHEIIHITLGHREHSTLAEKEANFGAAYIAAPPVVLSLFNPQTPLEVESLCQVSRQASLHGFNRYRSWRQIKQHHPMTDYELLLYKMFSTTKEAPTDTTIR